FYRYPLVARLNISCPLSPLLPYATLFRSGDFLPPGVHYEFDHTQNPPVITLLGPMADGVFELEYEYVPWASRNDPENGVTNRVRSEERRVGKECGARGAGGEEGEVELQAM